MIASLYLAAASTLRVTAAGFLSIATCAVPLLRWSRWLEDRAWRAAAKAPPEWLRRFWARDRPGHRQEGRDRG
ncbi:hypothetical protein [Methylobacterium tarhaniae]|uniref:hypothetical protein n=1 Tax=Methylobacterium tarhaniae TaxID=1187852 RepID=UPI003D04EDFB